MNFHLKILICLLAFLGIVIAGMYLYDPVKKRLYFSGLPRKEAPDRPALCGSIKNIDNAFSCSELIVFAKMLPIKTDALNAFVIGGYEHHKIFRFDYPVRGKVKPGNYHVRFVTLSIPSVEPPDCKVGSTPKEFEFPPEVLEQVILFINRTDRANVFKAIKIIRATKENLRNILTVMQNKEV